jgi:ferritin
MDYQNMRGGKVVFQDIAKPATMEWGTPLQAMEAALEIERTVSFLHQIFPLPS